MINWKVRFKNKNFWVAIIPAVIILIQAVAAFFGVTIDLSDANVKLLAIVDALFVVLTILGIVQDPTTHGIGDSERALGYDAPYKS